MFPSLSILIPPLYLNRADHKKSAFHVLAFGIRLLRRALNAIRLTMAWRAGSSSMDKKEETLNRVAVEIIEAGNHQEAATEHASAILTALSHIASEIEGVADGQERLVEEQREFKRFCLTNHLVPFGPFRARYNEKPVQKKSIASLVTKRFFANQGTPRRCFIQASSLALYLTEAIDADPSVPHQTLIHTNSAVAHLPILSGDSHGHLSIWPVGAESFDPNCGGWNIPCGTTGKTTENVRELFTREQDRLTTVFLMPLYVTPKDGVFYENRDAARFADLLSIADEVVILATGDRVANGRAELPKNNMLFDALTTRLSSDPAKYTLIVSTTPGGKPPLADTFRENLGTVYWESNCGWEFVTCRPTAKSGQWDAVA
jgi:hypothetical protein